MVGPSQVSSNCTHVPCLPHYPMGTSMGTYPHVSNENKKYSKQHSFYNHYMTNYIFFRWAIEKAIKEGIFKLVDKGVSELTVDLDLYLVMAMVTFTKHDDFRRKKKGNG